MANTFAIFECHDDTTQVPLRLVNISGRCYHLLCFQLYRIERSDKLCILLDEVVADSVPVLCVLPEICFYSWLETWNYLPSLLTSAPGPQQLLVSFQQFVPFESTDVVSTWKLQGLQNEKKIQKKWPKRQMKRKISKEKKSKRLSWLTKGHRSWIWTILHTGSRLDDGVLIGRREPSECIPHVQVLNKMILK